MICRWNKSTIGRVGGIWLGAKCYNKPVRKIEQFLFYFLLFAIPFQTRKILWHQNWNFNEWQSISIYGTDLILLALFVFWAFNYFQARKFLISNFKFLQRFPALRGNLLRANKSKFQNPNFYLFILVIVSIVSIKNSSSYILSVYSVLKLVEFIVFYFYIKNYAVYRFGLIGPMIALICGGLFQAIIAILQFFKQSDLGLRYLGESVLAFNLTGVASFYNLYGEKIMRAYGTTPHPNILAAYLFLAIFAFYFVYLYFHIYHLPAQAGQNKIYHPKFNLFILTSYSLILLSLFFTFARVMIFLWFAGFIIRSCLILGKQRFRKIFSVGINKVKLVRILTISTVVVVLFGIFYWPEAVSRVKISSGEEAVQLRIFYNKESLKSLNWFGVGSGNFVNWLMVKDPNLPRSIYQPVHNIYLLVYSETGIFGISALVVFLFFLVKDFVLRTRMKKLYHFSFLLVFLSVLFMGLFDHFLWTLQQGRFVFWLAVALLTVFKDSDIMVRQQSEPTA